ncbi:MAG TPA: hypothetical protein VFF11_11765 [Candidatus Binatia bacterium]|nr:hypothetical protein [Candidatus Binatia bacterium]
MLFADERHLPSSILHPRRLMDSTPDPQLLRSLGKLARGLSALFWGLPAALLICAQTARADWLKPLGFLPAVAVNGLLFYGLWQMRDFQRQERPWHASLDRAQLLSLIILGLCPFIYWHNKVPDEKFFSIAVMLMELAAVLFLFNLNLVLKRLGAMLPDETLRSETRQFTAFNRWVLVGLLFFAIVFFSLIQFPHPSQHVGLVLVWLNRFSNLLLIFFILLPLAMTMALIWKTKEVILDAVFGPRS